MKLSPAPVLRTCIACRGVLPRKKLLRVYLNKSGRVSLDAGNRGGGRGAYICAKIECLNKVRAKKGAFARAFRVKVPNEGLESFYKDMSDMLNAETGSEVMDESKLKSPDK
ncbi:MAG: YlxR family protein [Thermodesulfobacteriota bacterium]